jgi:hypothetical protein
VKPGDVVTVARIVESSEDAEEVVQRAKAQPVESQSGEVRVRHHEGYTLRRSGWGDVIAEWQADVL